MSVILAIMAVRELRSGVGLCITLTRIKLTAWLPP